MRQPNARWYKVEDHTAAVIPPIPMIFRTFERSMSGEWRQDRLGSWVAEHIDGIVVSLSIYATSPDEARQFYLRGLVEARRRFARLATEGDVPAA